jgi:hypothetical protein
MGSGGYSGGSYGGSGAGSNNKCGDTLIIQLIINHDRSSVWNNIAVNDDVYINLNKTSSLPIIEVLKITEYSLVGIAPPSYGWVIRCIESGWQYSGVVITKEGTEHDPRITVQLNGVK